MSDKKCTVRRNVLVEARVVLDPPDLPYWANTPERRMEALKDWVKEVQDFYRDHRSRDMDGLDVEAEYKDLCSVCGQEWEAAEDDETKETYCAYCGATLEAETKSVGDVKL
jgi:DNA-directed RNA polymerase subunit RPC12/RpoP